MKSILKWIWTYPVGIALIFLLPDWAFIGIAIMSFGVVAFFIDLIRSRKKVITPKDNEIIVKITWVLLPSGTKSPFCFSDWTDVAQVTQGTLSTITNELTVPALGGVIKSIKLIKGLDEVQTIIKDDGSRIVTIVTVPSKFELWVVKYLGIVSRSEARRLKEDNNTPKIIYQNCKAI